jgi:hypothetical protein
MSRIRIDLVGLPSEIEGWLLREPHSDPRRRWPGPREFLGYEERLPGDQAPAACDESPALAALRSPRGRRELHAALSRLSPIERLTLDLRYFHGDRLSYAEIAGQLGVFKAAVFKAEHRALRKLKEALEPLVVEEEQRRKSQRPEFGVDDPGATIGVGPRAPEGPVA